MESLLSRQESFAPKRVKNGSKFNPKWSHPTTFKANPLTLAEAGFYFDPSAADPDNVTCFMCSKQLSEWAEDDDPFDIHYSKCRDYCAWALLRCGLKADMTPDGRYVNVRVYDLGPMLTNKKIQIYR